MSEPRGWHSRGYLAHFDGGEWAQAVTFRLAGCLPRALLDPWRAEAEALPAERRDAAVRARIEQHLARGTGQAWLGTPAVAAVVEQSLLWADAERYRLHAWAIMPNHVQVLFTPMRGHELSAILQSWKGFAARRANDLLGRQGAFWQPDYYDRYVRDERHYAAEVAYIEGNPVKAGLCAQAGDWPWSSARRRA